MTKGNDKIEYIYQDGGLPGFRSIYKLYPKRDLAIIILSNYDYTNCLKFTNEMEQFIK